MKITANEARLAVAAWLDSGDAIDQLRDECYQRIGDRSRGGHETLTINTDLPYHAVVGVARELQQDGYLARYTEETHRLEIGWR